jgi:hypothetical protein
MLLLLARNGIEASRQRVGERVGGSEAIDQRPESADHRENAGHVTLVEPVDGEAGAGEVLHDPGLEVRESEDQVGRKRQDLRRVGRRERRAPQWPHGIARDADDPVFLAQEI